MDPWVGSQCGGMMLREITHGSMGRFLLSWICTRTKDRTSQEEKVVHKKQPIETWVTLSSVRSADVKKDLKWQDGRVVKACDSSVTACL